MGKKKTKSQSSPSVAALDQSTLNVTSANSTDLARYFDLRGLFYPNLDYPVGYLGLDKKLVPEFNKEFRPKGTRPSYSKKKTGIRLYAKFTRALDLYKICLALDGKTQKHQKAVSAIKKKLEEKYGKEVLEGHLK